MKPALFGNHDRKTNQPSNQTTEKEAVFIALIGIKVVFPLATARPGLTSVPKIYLAFRIVNYHNHVLFSM